MRTTALRSAILACVVIGHPPSAAAQVDQQRAQEYFKEALALCERDAGRLWGMSICAPTVIGDARTQTFATSQSPPDAPRPQLIGLINEPIKWGDMSGRPSPGTRLPIGRLAPEAKPLSMSRSTSSSQR